MGRGGSWRKSGSVEYLSSTVRAIASLCALARVLHWLAGRRVEIGIVSKDDVGRVRPRLFQGTLGGLAKFHNQPQCIRAAGRGLREPGGRHVADVPRNSFRAVRLLQFVDVRRVDADENQHLIERNGIAECFEDLSIELDQGKALWPLLAEGVEGERRYSSSVCRAIASRPGLARGS